MSTPTTFEDAATLLSYREKTLETLGNEWREIDWAEFSRKHIKSLIDSSKATSTGVAYNFVEHWAGECNRFRDVITGEQRLESFELYIANLKSVITEELIPKGCSALIEYKTHWLFIKWDANSSAHPTFKEDYLSGPSKFVIGY